MYDLLERAFKLQAVSVSLFLSKRSQRSWLTLLNDQGIIKFIQLADDSAQVPNLHKKYYADFKLTPNEWNNLDLLRQILKVSLSFRLETCSIAKRVTHIAPLSRTAAIFIGTHTHHCACVSCH